MYNQVGRIEKSSKSITYNVREIEDLPFCEAVKLGDEFRFGGDMRFVVCLSQQTAACCKGKMVLVPKGEVNVGEDRCEIPLMCLYGCRDIQKLVASF